MRIRIIQKPDIPYIDGVRLEHFEWGMQYDVNSALGVYMIAQGWANPITSDDPVRATPLSELDPDNSRDLASSANLRRESVPSYYDGLPALTLDRRRRPQRH